MNDPRKTSGLKTAEKALLNAARARLTRSRYIFPENFSVRLARRGTHQNDGMLFPLDTPDEALAMERAAGILQGIKEQGWDWALANYPREVVIGFAWNQDPVLVTYTTLVTRTVRLQRKLLRTDGAMGVLLVASDEVLRNTMEEWINSLDGMYCPFAYKSIGDALRRISMWEGRVTFALCDCGFWGTPNRFPEVLGELRQHVPTVPMVFVNISDALFLQMVGARYGYILRRTLPANALEPIRGTEDNAEAWGEAVRRYNASLWRNDQAGTVCPEGSSEPMELTQREEEILQGISKGLLNKEIAARLNISVNTVRNHICHIFQKLGISTRTEAAAWYLNR